MSQTQTQPKPPAADVQLAVFVRMAAVVRMTGLGRSTIYRPTKPAGPGTSRISRTHIDGHATAATAASKRRPGFASNQPPHCRPAH